MRKRKAAVQWFAGLGAWAAFFAGLGIRATLGNRRSGKLRHREPQFRDLRHFGRNSIGRRPVAASARNPRWSRACYSAVVKRSIVTVPVERLAAPADGRAGEPPAEAVRDTDLLAVEEPLQIRLNGRDLAITMRTPGHDEELATGFLFTEGILPGRTAIASITQDGSGPSGGNAIEVRTTGDASPDLSAQTRHFYLTSSCGVCGKASVDALVAAGCTAPAADRPRVDPDVIRGLPEKLRATQPVFERTGGLHAAALFDAQGNLQLVREDIGRHNALDKLIGRLVLDEKIPVSDSILLMSSRASFELIQKALMAGIGVLCAVGAPSSLAVETALRFGMTLAGFVRDGRFNLYSGETRIG